MSEESKPDPLLTSSSGALGYHQSNYIFVNFVRQTFPDFSRYFAIFATFRSNSTIMSEERSLNFIEEIVEEDIRRGQASARPEVLTSVFRQSLMDTCILAMPHLYA